MRGYKLSNRANFYMRLCALIMVILFLIIDLISSIYFPLGKFKSLGYGERVANYYAYFTTESNYIVVIYFCVYLFDSHFRGLRPSFQTRLAVTVYITITMLVFWIGIFTAEQDPAQYNFYNWISTVILHLIVPSAMITSFVLTSGQQYVEPKKQYKIYLWLIAIYPTIYCVVILIRGHLRYLDYMDSIGHGVSPPHPPKDTWYPYFFFNYWTPPYGWIIATAAVFFIFSLVFGLQYFYIYINNLMYKNLQSPEHRLHDFYQKVLHKLNKLKKYHRHKDKIENKNEIKNKDETKNKNDEK